MERAYFHLLHLLAGHPIGSLVLIFLAAFLEAIVVIGTFIPGSTAIFVAGALVGTGALNLDWVLVCTIAGAVAGDGISYWLGNHYQARIAHVWPFRTHARLLDGGRAFFAKHGAKSVVFARFIGPVRAVVPVVAGMAGMAPVRFYVMNILSAMLWAPAYILLGIVFGASVQVASAVSFRLVITIGLLAGIMWLSFRAARFFIGHIDTWRTATRSSLVTWATCHGGRLGRLILRALDPAHPATGVMTAISLFVLLSAWAFFRVLDHAIHGSTRMGIDVSVYHFLQSLRTPWGDVALSSVATLGSITTLAVLSVTVAGWMVWEHRWRTLAYWLTVIAFSQLLIFAIHLAIHRAPPGAAPPEAHVFPSTHVAGAVVVYGFLAFLLARRVGSPGAVFVVATSSVVVLFVALAGLYFGQFWFSDAVGGAALGAVWVSLVALTAVWRHPTVPPSRKLMPAVVLGVIFASVSVQLRLAPPAGASDSTRPQPLILTTESQWINSLWKSVPCYRSDLTGDRAEPLALQWSATADDLRNRLRKSMWVEGTEVSARSILSLASPQISAMALPVMPQLNDGVPSPLVFARPGRKDDERDVLRFWPSGYAVKDEGDAKLTPIWVGSLEHESLYRQPWPINMLRVVNTALPKLATGEEWPARGGATVLASVDCRGTPVLLLRSQSH